MRPPVVFAMFALLLASCGGSADPAGHQSEWLNVLGRKKLASAPLASVSDRQAYADSLTAFVGRHPSHDRARQVFHRIQLDFARELASLGRHQDAIRFYRTVLTSEPRNEAALLGLAASVDHLAITRAKLLALERGMSPGQVSALLGKPVPGWKLRTFRHDVEMESWYYRKSDGGVAGVFFRDGEVFAADENAHATLSPLTPATAKAESRTSAGR